MISKEKIVGIGKNKVLLYVTSRYVTYGIQFINSMFIAVALGPQYLAVWGFVNLILQYVAQFNWGIPYSLNVLLSINRTDDFKVSSLLSNSLFLYILLSFVILLFFFLLHVFSIDVGAKYSFGKYSILVILIAILTHFNTVFTNYFRILNQLGEIIFFQSVLPISMLIAICFEKGEPLLRLVLWIMLIGQFLSLLLYIKNSHMRIMKPKASLVSLLLRKGVFLFIYNTCFYLILLSTRTVVSMDYQVEEFGFFTFSFTLANVIMLLFDSFSFLIYPKTINRFNRASKEEVIRIFDLIRVNYITCVHLVMYLFLAAFPLIINLFPQYNSVFKCFALMALTIVFYSNCFAFSSFLTACGKEYLLSLIAFIVLVINILCALFISRVLKLGYEYVILATLLSYIVYNILLSFFSYKIIHLPRTLKNLLRENFSPRFFIPFFICLSAVVLDMKWFVYVGLLFLFIVMNWKQIAEIRSTISRIIQTPAIINI